MKTRVSILSILLLNIFVVVSHNYCEDSEVWSLSATYIPYDYKDEKLVVTYFERHNKDKTKYSPLYIAIGKSEESLPRIVTRGLSNKYNIKFENFHFTIEEPVIIFYDDVYKTIEIVNMEGIDLRNTGYNELYQLAVEIVESKREYNRILSFLE